MRLGGLAGSALAVFFIATAANAQQGEKSYLPPPAYQSKPGAVAKHGNHQNSAREKHAVAPQARRRMRTARRGYRRYPRYAYAPPPFLFFPPAFFSMFR